MFDSQGVAFRDAMYARNPSQVQKLYEGRRSHGQVSVTVNGRVLDPRFDLRNHSPDGFEWGYGGSGPSQLALALLADCLKDDRRALSLYQDFKWKVVSALPQEGWTLTDDEIHQALQTMPGIWKGHKP